MNHRTRVQHQLLEAWRALLTQAYRQPPEPELVRAAARYDIRKGIEHARRQVASLRALATSCHDHTWPPGEARPETIFVTGPAGTPIR